MTGAPHYALACAFGWMFLVSGGMKLRSRREFALHLMSLRVLSPAACRLAAIFVPLGEIAVGALLLSGLAGALAAGATLLLLLVFTGYVAWILSTGRRASCFCFGESTEPTTRDTLLRNFGMLGAAALLLALELLRAGPLTAHVYVLGLVHGLSAFFVFLSATELLRLRRLKVVLE